MMTIMRGPSPVATHTRGWGTCKNGEGGEGGGPWFNLRENKRVAARSGPGGIDPGRRIRPKSNQTEPE